MFGRHIQVKLVKDEKPVTFTRDAFGNRIPEEKPKDVTDWDVNDYIRNATIGAITAMSVGTFLKTFNEIAVEVAKKPCVHIHMYKL